MCLMLCAPLDWQYAELPSSASDAVLCSAGFRATLENLEKVPIFRKLRENLENSGKKIENWNDSGKTQGIFLTGIKIFF